MKDKNEPYIGHNKSNIILFKVVRRTLIRIIIFTNTQLDEDKYIDKSHIVILNYVLLKI